MDIMKPIRASTGESGLKVLPEVFKPRLIQLADETIESLQQIWLEAGYDTNECNSLLGDLLNKIKITCSNELLAEQQILDHAKEQLNKKIVYYNNLSTQLGRNTINDNELGNNYANKFHKLDKLINIIEIDYKERENLLLNEYNTIVSLSNDLGESLPTFESFKGSNNSYSLSDSRLNQLKETVQLLNQMKIKRIDEIKQLVSDCSSIVIDLEIMNEGWNTLKDKTDFTLYNNAISSFIINKSYTLEYHKNNILLLNQRLSTLQNEKDYRRNELSKIGEEIARLWTLLRIPTIDRDNFQLSFKMNLSFETLNKGYSELDRLQTIRQTSLKKVISMIRYDILKLWEEVAIDDENHRRNEFIDYYKDIDTLDDSAVEEHESYFNKLKGRVDELRPVLNKISRREAIVKERIELEHIQLNPERLIARGPNAREERKREEGMTVRVKNLDKITKEILSQIVIWEEQHGPFLFAGERYAERVIKQEENYIEIRDSLRNARKKKDLPKQESINLKSSLTKRTGSTITSSYNYNNSFNSTKSKDISMDISIASLSINDENYLSSQRISNESDDTEYTSITEVRERPSSATVVKSQYL